MLTKKEDFQFQHNDKLFEPMQEIQWNLPEYQYTKTQTEKMKELISQFKYLLHGQRQEENMADTLQPDALKNSIFLSPTNTKRSFNFSNSKKFTRSNYLKQSKLKLKRDIKEFAKRMSRNLAVLNQTTEANLDEFNNLDNFGVKTIELQELFNTINSTNTSVIHVAFYTSLLNIPKYNGYLEKFEEYGFFISCFEDMKMAANFPKYTTVVTPISEISNNMVMLENCFHVEKNIAGVLVFRDADKQSYNSLKHKSQNFHFFDNFSTLFEFLVVNVS